MIRRIVSLLRRRNSRWSDRVDTKLSIALCEFSKFKFAEALNLDDLWLDGVCALLHEVEGLIATNDFEREKEFVSVCRSVMCSTEIVIRARNQLTAPHG